MVLAGSGPLLTLLAHQLIAAGGTVVAVLDTAPLGAQIRAGLAMAAARPGVTLRGLGLRARLGRRYRAGVSLVEIEGDAAGPKALTWRDARGRLQRVNCDMVALGWHLRADGTLADLAGADFGWDRSFQQWLPQADPLGRAGAGLYLAGDGLRILGADGAELAGRAAAIACLQDLGLRHPDPAPILRQLRRMRRFAEAMARAFPWPAEAIAALPDDAVLCRCEGIRAGEVRAVLPESGVEANRVKSLSRIGMGRCQGRYCQLAGAELMAAATGAPVAQMGRLRAQPPARPAPMGACCTTRNEGVAE